MDCPSLSRVFPGALCQFLVVVTTTERSTKDRGISRLAFFYILVAKRRSAIDAQDADPPLPLGATKAGRNHLSK
jgi:hypothetical protein